MSSIEEIQNYLQLSERVGTAGQPFRQQFPLLAEAGYQVVINLAMPDSMDAVPDEAELVRGQGLEYIAIPVKWEAPRLEDLGAFFAQMDRLQGRKVFVHCARNMRVSAFMFLYRVIREGFPQMEVSHDLQRIWAPNETWQEFIQEALTANGINAG